MAKLRLIGKKIVCNHRESNPGLLRAAILYAVTAVRRQETISPELDLGRRLDHTLLKVPIGRQVFYH